MSPKGVEHWSLLWEVLSEKQCALINVAERR